MLAIRRKKYFLTYSQYWFAKEPIPNSFWQIVCLRQYLGICKPLLFIRQPFYTLLLDLTKSEEELVSLMAKNTWYEIKRAARDELIWKDAIPLQEFLNFYNKFALAKRLNAVSLKALSSLGKAFVATGVYRSDEPLVMHGYLVDEALGRVRLLYSGSDQMLLSSQKALLGRANRRAHWLDILHFKKLGFKVYDFGGIEREASNQAGQGIAAFKKGFGGREVREDHYESLLFYLAKRLVER